MRETVEYSIKPGDGFQDIFFANGVRCCFQVPSFMGIKKITIEFEPRYPLKPSHP